MTDARWKTLLEQVEAVHNRLPDLTDFCAFPDPVTVQEIEPRHDPLSDTMRADTRLYASEKLMPLRDAFLDAAPAAKWRDTYKDTGYGVTLHANFGCYEVLGRDTPLGVEGMRSFVIYQKPGFHYPMHHHPAEEIYLVVAGEGEFHLEGERIEGRPIRTGSRQSAPLPARRQTDFPAL